MQFATNHLGHFDLTTGLHGALAAASVDPFTGCRYYQTPRGERRPSQRAGSSCRLSCVVPESRQLDGVRRLPTEPRSQRFITGRHHCQGVEAHREVDDQGRRGQDQGPLACGVRRPSRRGEQKRVELTELCQHEIQSRDYADSGARQGLQATRMLLLRVKARRRLSREQGGGGERWEGLTNGVALDAATDLLGGLALGEVLLECRRGVWGGTHAGQHDGVSGARLSRRSPPRLRHTGRYCPSLQGRRPPPCPLDRSRA